MAVMEPCTNNHAKTRHLSADLAHGPDTPPGRWGTSMCFIPSPMLDQEALDAEFAIAGEHAPRIVDLPLCKACARRRAR